MMGQWRVEVTPGAPRTDDIFLHVIEVGGRDAAPGEPAQLLRDGDRVGTRVTLGTRTFEVLFTTKGAPGGHIRIRGPNPLDRDLTTEVTAQSGI